MEQEALYFGENGIIKSVFHKSKRPININELDIEGLVLSHKKSYAKDSFRYFIVKRPQMNAYAKHFDKNNKLSESDDESDE